MKLFDFNWFSNMAGYSGNIQADLLDQEHENGCSVTDRYLCTECGAFTNEKFFIKECNCCSDCFSDKAAK